MNEPTEVPIKKKGFGIASFVLAVIYIPLIVYYYFVPFDMAFDMAFMDQADEPSYLTFIDIFRYPIVITGIVLGTIGLKGKDKVYAPLGIIGNILVLISPIIFLIMAAFIIATIMSYAASVR